MSHGVGIIGLGVVGQRTLANMNAHERLAVARAWDPNPAARESAAGRFGGLRIVDGAAAVLNADDVDLVYIACPPLNHAEYVIAALQAEKAIFCEKPLGIDVAASRELVSRVEQSARPGAVNFVHGSATAAVELERRLRAGTLGGIVGVDVRLHFAEWPRPWQKAAAWLEKREQGGFVREVLSHFVFLVHRLFGPARLVDAEVRFPAYDPNLAETHVLAALDCAGLPVLIAGTSGGRGPDQVEFTVWGDESSCRISNWYGLAASEGGQWSDQLAHIENLAQDTYTLQLDQLAAMVEGRDHRLPSFREALVVQELIEDLLRR